MRSRSIDGYSEVMMKRWRSACLKSQIDVDHPNISNAPSSKYQSPEDTREYSQQNYVAMRVLEEAYTFKNYLSPLNQIG